jgi:FSR family fosmidomycin resistance protein-like MFS transporter
MFNLKPQSSAKPYKKYWKQLASLSFLFLLIEFFDELTYAIDGAALPSIRHDLALTYAQVGLLLGLPHLLGAFIEPVLMLLGDTSLRKRLVIGGGLVVILALLLIATAQSFSVLLAAVVLSFPASGAFVTLSQATLIDLNPRREPHMMARWTLFGSIGNLVGPLILAAGFSLLLGWRWVFFALAGIALCLTILVWLQPFPVHIPSSELHKAHPKPGVKNTLQNILGNLFAALTNLNLLRWTGLLLISDLLLDIFTSYLPLYFTDVVGISPAQASLLLSLGMAASLASDVVLIPLLEKIPGRTIVRLSALAVAILYPVWLLIPGLWAKIILVLVIKFITLGWYSVLQGEAYASAPGRSGTVMAINSLAGIPGAFFPWIIGWSAGKIGLKSAMWILLLGPVCLALFVPKAEAISKPNQQSESLSENS